MPYVEIEDFKKGLDTRRPAIVGEPGTLIECENAHITRGGDVENAKSFEPEIALPAGTVGLHSAKGRLYVFGSAAAPTNLPGQVVYQRLQHPSSGNLTAVLSGSNYDGKIYSIGEFDDGSVYHYYNGARVTDVEAMAATIADDESVAAYLADKIDALAAVIATAVDLTVTITAAVAGTAFTISVSDVGTGTIAVSQLQANQTAVAETRAVGAFTVTGGFALDANTIATIQAGATNLISAPVPYVLDNDATALACVIKINQGTATHGYSASVAGAVVTIRAPVGQGATANGRTLTVTPAGAVTVGSVTNFASGVTAVAAKPQIERVTIGGTFDVTNTYTITLNGTAYLITGLASGMGRLAKTLKEKMHTGVRGLMSFSSVADVLAWTSGVGYGFINISSQDEGSQLLTALGIYQSRMAIFTRTTIQIWAIDPDPLNNSILQILQNTGTRSPDAVLGFGDSDLMYVSDTGIRSIKARDSQNNASTDDIGTRIDDNVVAWLKTLTDAEIVTASGVVEPSTGRAWIALKNRIYAFSYFPGSRVSAWTYYQPGFTVDRMVTASGRVYLRSGNTIYIYGGTSGDVYPDDGEVEVRVRLPFLDANRMAQGKKIKGVDIICGGEWSINLLLDPRDETLMTETIRVSGPTTLIGQIPVYADTTHFAPLLTSEKGGRLTLSSVAVHFDEDETT